MKMYSRDRLCGSPPLFRLARREIDAPSCVTVHRSGNVSIPPAVASKMIYRYTEADIGEDDGGVL